MTSPALATTALPIGPNARCRPHAGLTTSRDGVLGIGDVADRDGVHDRLVRERDRRGECRAGSNSRSRSASSNVSAAEHLDDPAEDRRSRCCCSSRSCPASTICGRSAQPATYRASASSPRPVSVKWSPSKPLVWRQQLRGP